MKTRSLFWETHWRQGLLAIFALALCLRLYAVTQFPSPVISDSTEYESLARQLAAGNGYVGPEGLPTAFRTPGYPAFIALIYRVAGPQVPAVYLTQAILGSVTAVLIALLGIFIFSARISLLAGLLTAIYPGYIWLSRVMLSEVVALPLLLGALICAAQWTRTNRASWLLLSGLLLGMGTLVRGSTVLVVAFLLLFLWLWQRKQSGPRRHVASLLALLAGVAIVVLPWGLRNYQTFGHLSLATEEGTALYFSYWPPIRDGKRMWGNVGPGESKAVAIARENHREAEFSHQRRSETLRRLAANPSYYFRLLPEKFAYLLVPIDWEFFPRAQNQSRSSNWFYLLLIAPAMLGLWRLRAQKSELAWLLAVLPSAVFLQTLLFYGGPRFRLPAEATLLLLAAAGFCYLWETLVNRKSAQPHDATKIPTAV